MSDFERITAALTDVYAIERELGQGGMATVYLAEDLKHHRQVTIKVMRQEIAAALGGERFLRGIEIAGRLQHPNILMLLDSGEVDDVLYYVMPYVEGESLAQRLDREGQLPIDDALQIARDVASALGHAHAQGVIHRDLNPDNIMLTGGHAVVMDFGIGDALAAEQENLTQTAMSLGTPSYTSPEQAAGGRNIDGRTDVYAMGAVLYHMLVGEPPYTGATPEAILAKRASDPIPSARRIRETIPSEVDVAIGKSLAQEPTGRYATAEEFAAAIIPDMSASAESAIPFERKHPLRSTLYAGLVAAVVVIAAAVIAVTSMERGGVPNHITLAVLPFQTVGPAEDEFFAEGMTVELADRLGRLDGVSVVGRSSQTGTSLENMTPSEIGRTLGAEYLLSGTVRWAKAPDGTSRVRINPQLARSSDEERVWGEPYDGAPTDVFTLQADVAEQVAQALNVSLLAGEERELRRAPTENLAAWQAYSLGRSYFARYDGAGAIGHYQEAIELDPDFALAYVGLADAYHFAIPTTASGKLDQRTDNWARGEQAARRALALDSTLGPGYVSLGSIYMFRDFDWDRAEENMLRGLALDPSYAQGHSRYLLLLQATGRTDSALAEARRAVSLDPLSLLYNNYLGTALIWAGHTEEALRQLDRVLSIDPTFATAHVNKSGAYAVLGDWDAVAEALRAYGRLPPQLVDLLYAALIDRKNNAELLSYVDQLPPQAIAALASTLGYLLPVIGENQRALDMIEMAIAGHAGHMVIALDFPLMAPLQDEPRFQALRREMGLEVVMTEQ